VDPAVLVVGSVNVDLIWKLPRLPAPGETTTGGELEEGPGGKGANAAAAAARLAVRTSFVGLVGRDERGKQARADLERAGVDTSLLGTTASAPTGVAAILVNEAGENMVAVASGANAEVDGERVRAAFDAVAADRPVILSNLEIPDEAVAAAAAGASERGWPFVLNPAPARPVAPEVIRACELLIPNEGEAAMLGGVDALLEAGNRAVAVTLGGRGVDLHRPHAPVEHVPALAVKVVDTTGAGDAFCGGLVAGLAEGLGLEDAVRWGSAAGALACRGVGARSSLGTREELEELLRRRDPRG
jgi:ribokinase